MTAEDKLNYLANFDLELRIWCFNTSSGMPFAKRWHCDLEQESKGIKLNINASASTFDGAVTSCFDKYMRTVTIGLPQTFVTPQLEAAPSAKPYDDIPF